MRVLSAAVNLARDISAGISQHPHQM